ncbi:hypothetical protein LTR27_004786 [Elasticomyces elasticus]|nr:hypothetical protein LTR27_004786 [Elasticomyces elasticus]
MALATSAAAVSQTARAARDTSSVLDDLLINAKFKDDSLRLGVKYFLEDIETLQSRLAISEDAQSYGREEQQALHARLLHAMTLCAGTFDQLTVHARDAGKVKSGIFRQARKLSAKDEAIIRAKQRIPVHAMAVQLLIGAFNVYRILQELHLSALAESVRNLQRTRARLQPSCQVNSPHLGQDQELCDSVAGLVAESDSILKYATTVLEDPSKFIQDVTASISVQGEGNDVGVHSSVGTSNVHPASTNQPNPYQQSSVGRSDSNLAFPPQLPQKSVLRAPRIEFELDSQDFGLISPVSAASPAEGSSTVIQWMDNVEERERRPRPAKDGSAASIVSSSVMSGGPASTTISDSQSPSLGERLSSGQTSWTLPSISGSLREKVDTSEDDDFDDDAITIELARNIIITGQSGLDKADHQAAKSCFLEALILVQKLPRKAQVAACDMLDLRYQVAMCCLVLDGQAEVEKTLVEVLQHEPSSDMQREKLFHVSHTLSQLYITTGRLNVARQSCNNALRGRRKLLGKDHEDYYSSLALMARICEFEGADIQAKAYKDMIPAAEQHKFAFDHIKMDVFSEKEAVEIGDSERHSLSSERTIQDSASQKAAQQTPDYTHGASPTVADRQFLSSKESIRPIAPSLRKAPSMQSSMASEDMRKHSIYGRVSHMSDTSSETALRPDPLSIARSREPASAPLPGPGNDYLGFCKAAWQLQSGDRSALKKIKHSSLGGPTTYWLCCTGPKCYFTTEIETSAIGTWESVERRYSRLGVVYRFPFLAKSHVRQNKVAAGQALYKCLFCISLGMHTPIIQGAESYIDHVARKHRASELSQVILYRAGCVNDRICTAEEDFDINLYPVISV